MENNESQPDEKQQREKQPKEEMAKPLLSQREVRSIVKDFAIAYIEGRITLGLMEANERMSLAKLKGKELSFADAIDAEARDKIQFRNLIAVCLGSKKATPDELQHAICDLFDEILALRNGKRIQGVFYEHDLETRVKEIEEGLDKVNNLVEDIVEWITGLPSDRKTSNDESMS